MKNRLALFFALIIVWSVPAFAQNPNILTPSPQTLTTQSSGVTDCTRNTTCAFWDIGSQRSATIQVSGTFSGTMTFEASSDGTNWATVTLTKLADASAVTTATAAGQYAVVNTGVWYLRARATTWASGTANLTAVFGNGTIPLIPSGSVAPSTATYWIATSNASLPNAKVLGSQGTALVISTTGTGAPSAYAGTSCTNQFVRSLSAVGAATCATVSLTADVTGTLPVANGGTSLATLTAHALYAGNGTSAPTALTVGATGTVLAGSTGADPAFTATPTVTSVTMGTAVLSGGSFFSMTGGLVMASNTNVQLQGSGNFQLGSTGTIYWGANTPHLNSLSNGVMLLRNAAETAGVALDAATDSTLKVFARDGSSAGTVQSNTATFAAYNFNGTSGKTGATCSAFTVGGCTTSPEPDVYARDYLVPWLGAGGFRVPTFAEWTALQARVMSLEAQLSQFKQAIR